MARRITGLVPGVIPGISIEKQYYAERAKLQRKIRAAKKAGKSTAKSAPKIPTKITAASVRKLQRQSAKYTKKKKKKTPSPKAKQIPLNAPGLPGAKGRTRVHGETPLSEQAYRSERERVRQLIKDLEGRGYIIDASAKLPKIPKTITWASVRRLQRMTPEYFYSHSEYVDYYTGEVLQGRSGRQHELNMSPYERRLQKKLIMEAAGTGTVSKQPWEDRVIDNAVWEWQQELGGKSACFKILTAWLAELIKKYGKVRVAVMLEDAAAAGIAIRWEQRYDDDAVSRYMKDMLDYLGLPEEEKKKIWDNIGEIKDAGLFGDLRKTLKLIPHSLLDVDDLGTKQSRPKKASQVTATAQSPTQAPVPASVHVSDMGQVPGQLALDLQLDATDGGGQKITSTPTPALPDNTTVVDTPVDNTVYMDVDTSSMSDEWADFMDFDISEGAAKRKKEQEWQRNSKKK